MPTNLDRIKALETKVTALQAQSALLTDRVAALEAPVVVPPPPPVTPPPPSDPFYGPGYISKAKGNLEVHGPGGHGTAIACAFTAKRGGTVDRIRVQWKSDPPPNYGSGDGGTYTFGVQALIGEKPDGIWIARREGFRPGVVPSGGIEAVMTMRGSLVVGQRYAIVIQNTHADEANNHGSWNLPWSGSAPCAPDAFMLTGGPSAWAKNTDHLPAFDLAYADGGHEGYAGIQGQDWDYNPSVVGIVNANSIGRWSFTAPEPTVAKVVYFYLQKAAGSTDAVVDIKVNGIVVAQGTFLTSSDLATGARGFCKATLSTPVSIKAGDKVEVFVSSTSEYRLPLMLWGDSGNGPTPMRSFPYVNGVNPHRADDGPTGTTPCWSSRYADTTFGAFFEL